MECTFKLFSGKEAVNAASIARKSRLYVNTWSMRSMFIAVENNLVKDAQIAIAYSGDSPIAAVITYKNETHVFVRKSYRGKGIASSLIKNTGITVKSTWTGIKGSDKFWSKVK